ncbi:MAG: PEP-CTERM sorting domain-containing protein [Candidatus Eiseniibacteriota bacterium]|nr:MAG: PEP-CTERM sorting domain-containing protein [Candidatus Eisenbacteria bacterium]
MKRPIAYFAVLGLCILAVPALAIASSGFYWPDGNYMWDNRNINRQLRFSVDGTTWGINSPDPDPWLNDSFIVTSNPFSFWILNHSRRQRLDDVLLYMVYKGSFGSITVGDVVLTSADFAFSPRPPLWQGGNRPGGGEAGVYKHGWMAMASLGEGLLPRGTLMRTVTIDGASPDFMLHLDAYGAVGSAGSGFTIVSTNPNSSDVTFTPEPATIVLMGLGLTGVGVYLRKRMRKS